MNATQGGGAAVERAGEYDFGEECELLVKRGADAYFDRGEAEIVRHWQWLRGGPRERGQTADKLVGMAEGLRDVLLSWGVPEANLCAGEIEAEGHFFDRRKWDFGVVGANSKPIVLVEFKCAAGRLGYGRVRLDMETITAMSLGSKMATPAGQPLFRGAIVVVPGFRRPEAARNESLRVAGERSGIERLTNAAKRLIAADLLDAIVAMHLDGRTFSPVCDALSPKVFLRRLNAFLKSLPESTWQHPSWQGDQRSAVSARADSA